MTEFNTSLNVISESPYFASNFIPAATVQVHASNLLQLPNGDLLCAWFGGSQEGLSDICIYLSRLRSGARIWTQPQQVSNDQNRSEQNPVLFLNPQSQDSELWIMYTAQPAGNQDRAVVRYRVSKDEGQTWGPAAKLFEDSEGLFIRQPIAVLKDGTWVLPAWYCRTPPGYRWIGSDDISVVKYSCDAGKSWHEKEVPGSLGCVHMNIKPTLDGKYIAFFRSRWADNIYTSSSSDGITWAKPETTVLPNPNSGICFDVLSSGRLIIVYNDSAYQPGQTKREGLYDDITPSSDKRLNQPATHANKKEAVWGVPRKTMTVGISADGGRTWKKRVLQEGDGFCLTNNSERKENRELSYPSICVERGEGRDEDGEIVNVAFTFWRQRIAFCRFGVGWVEG